MTKLKLIEAFEGARTQDANFERKLNNAYGHLGKSYRDIEQLETELSAQGYTKEGGSWIVKWIAHYVTVSLI